MRRLRRPSAALPPKLQQQIGRLNVLPKAQQQVVLKILDRCLARPAAKEAIHGTHDSVAHREAARGCHHDSKNSWLAQLLTRRHTNIAAVALANKNARTAWALLAHDREFKPDYVPLRAAA